MNINPKDLFKNLQNLQSNMGEMQEKMKNITAIGTSGGDMVRIEINGKMEVTNVTISPEAVDPNDVQMLQDLILAAFTNAMNNVREKLQSEFSDMTGGMNMPTDFMGQ